MKYIAILLILFSLNVLSQESKLDSTMIQYYKELTTNRNPVRKDLGIVTGLNITKVNYFGEIGFYKSRIEEAVGFKMFSHQFSIGSEFLINNKGFIIAPKLQGKIHLGILKFSLSSIYYTNFKGKESIKLRPEIGIGMHSWGISYGRNSNIYNNSLDAGKHLITIRVFIQIIKKPIANKFKN